MANNMTMSNGFQAGYGTSIWSPNLTPMSEPAYIGALVGLFILSVGFRALVAAQGYLEAYLHLHYYPRPSSHSSAPNSHAQTHKFRHSQQKHRHQATTGIQESEKAAEMRESTPRFVDEKNDGVSAIIRPETLQGQEFHGQGVQPVRDEEEEEEEAEGVSLHHQGPLRTTPKATSTVSATAIESETTTNVARHRRYGAQRHHIPPLYHPNPYNSSDYIAPFFPLPTAQPFVWQAEVSRAVLTTGVVGIGYMLMLVIMTYHSAYFGVILAGIFVGEVYFGRWGRARPIFPSSSSSSSLLASSQHQSRAACEPQPQQPSQQHQQRQSVGTTIPSSFNKNSNPYINGNVNQRPAASMTSLTSRSSSQGHFSTMIPHGISADGTC